MEKAVADGQLEFAVVNPAQYIELEVKYGASAIATQISHSAQTESSYFGTVIFTRANRADIATLSDLKGKSLITASKTAFASWVVTRDELMREGIEYGGLSSVRFANSSADKVQYPLKKYILHRFPRNKCILPKDQCMTVRVRSMPFLLWAETLPI